MVSALRLMLLQKTDQFSMEVDIPSSLHNHTTLSSTDDPLDDATIEKRDEHTISIENLETLDQIVSVVCSLPFSMVARCRRSSVLESVVCSCSKLLASTSMLNLSTQRSGTALFVQHPHHADRCHHWE